MPRRAKTPRWLSAAREANRTGSDWLSRALGRAGALPPEELEAAIAGGRVRLDGKVTTKPFAPVSAQSKVTVDGLAVSLERRTRVLMLHKPAGVIAEGGRDARPSVMDVLKPLLDAERGRYTWLAVGRLDVDTTGLLLFTNDERLVAHATSPQTHLAKRYLATVNEKATEEQLEPLRRGVTLDDGPARPAEAKLVERGVVALTLTEGRNHQVKRMLAAVGLPVLKLHREAIGDLKLDIEEGQLRELTPGEIAGSLGFTPTSAAGKAR